MPTDENKQQSTEVTSQSTDDSTAGDILEQLKADNASTINIYKLEQKLLRLVTNIDKTATHENKSITQLKRDFNDVTKSIKNIDKTMSTVGTTLSSVDSSMRQVLSLLEQIHEIHSSSASTPPPVPVNPLTDSASLANLADLLDKHSSNSSVDTSDMVTLTNLTELFDTHFKNTDDSNATDITLASLTALLDRYVQDLRDGIVSAVESSNLAEVLDRYNQHDSGDLSDESKLSQLLRQRQQFIDDYDGSMDYDEFQEHIDDFDDAIARLTELLDRQNKVELLRAQAADDYSTLQNPFESDLKDLISRYESGDISEESFKIFLSSLQEQIDSQIDMIDEARRTWQDDGTRSLSRSYEQERAQVEKDYNDRFKTLTDMYTAQVPDEDGNIMSDADYSDAILQLTGERNDALSSVDSMIKVTQSLDNFINDFASGNTYDVKTGENHTAAAAIQTVGAIGGELGGEAVGAAIGTAIGGPVGTIVGGIIGDVVGSKIEAVGDLLADRIDYFVNHSKKTRDEILKAGLDKIRSDVKDMATYSIEIYEGAAKSIYDAWDKNISQVNATQGYTKEALNTLQDSVAQRLQKEGYGNTINASEYVDQLANTLNANLGGPLAEAFAAQNLILQKAVPEIDLSASAAEFAAIYTNATRQGGNGEEQMVAAMNEVAGAAKALETVTGGNNQFLKETGALLTKATEVINIAGGNADQIAGLTTQMMASEAAITSVAPQLNGFTNELVGILMNNNDATAVSLRAIMNDMNSNIGVSATSFMQSFMSDTQGTLSTAFAAIQKFIDQNENDASRQEFLHAMESVFGVQGSKLAQIDFGSVAAQIAQTNTSTNMAALTDAENLVRGGETTTLEEQLLANTANQLLATNAIASTLDNSLMRKLEANELTMEKVVYSLQAEQSVDLAENTLDFFTGIFDLITSLLDPFGLFDGLITSINAGTSAAIDAERYVVTTTASSIGSAVANSSASAANDFANTIGGATAVIAAAETKSTDAMVGAIAAAGVSPTFEGMMMDYSMTQATAAQASARASAESNAISYASMEQQARQSSEYQQKQDEAMQQNSKYEEDKAAAREQQKAEQEAENIRNLENHDNIVIIKDAIDGLNISEYLTPILDEHRTHTEQIKDLQAQTTEIVRLLSTVLEYSLVTSPEFASTMSFDEKSRIMDNGYVGGLKNGALAAFL